MSVLVGSRSKMRVDQDMSVFFQGFQKDNKEREDGLPVLWAWGKVDDISAPR